MSDTGANLDNTGLYRYSRPGGTEVETRQGNGDDEAEAYARELSKAQDTPIIIERQDHVDWEYVTEVDERP